MVGGLYENPISRRHVHSSIPYFQDDITWCVSKAGFAPTWMNVFVIFNCKSSLRKAYYKSLKCFFFLPISYNMDRPRCDPVHLIFLPLQVCSA